MFTSVGFLVAITNPKALVFYVAFLPQFVDSHLPAGPPLLVMIVTMIIMALSFRQRLCAAYRARPGLVHNSRTASAAKPHHRDAIDRHRLRPAPRAARELALMSSLRCGETHLAV